LDILYAWPEDSGTYECHAVNATGRATASASLEVGAKAGLLLDTMDSDRLHHLRSLENRDRSRPEEEDAPITAPQFTTPLRNVEGVPEQGHVHMECRLQPVNDPNLRVEWFVNSKPIPQGHRFRTTHDFGYVALDILYAYAEDSGTYMCKATNALGEAVNTGSVNVVARDSLLLDSQHPEGWEKMKSLEGRNIHRLLDVEELPIGPPHFVTELVGNTTLNEGGVAHLEAQIEPIHDPDLRVEFLKDGQALKQGSRIHTLCDFGYVALDVSGLIESDAGEYECRVFNKLGEARSKVRLTVSGRDRLDTSSQRPEGLDKIVALESRRGRAPEEEARTFQKPVFTHALDGVEAEEGASAHLAARLIPVGDPSLKVEWFKDGQVISSGSRINYINDFGCVTLDISSLRPADEGNYECRATNALGSATTTASVKVHARGTLMLDSQHPEGMRKITALEMGKAKRQLSEAAQAFEKPAFLTPLTGTSEVAESRNAHMECRVVPVGDPSMKFEWYKNGEQLKTGSRINYINDFGFVTLDVASCIDTDSGVYMVKAVNNAGEATSSFVLKVGEDDGSGRVALHPDSFKKIQALEAQKAAAADRTTGEGEGVVEQPPVFMQQLPAVGSVPEGSDVRVDAVVEPRNDPTLKVDWELNGKPLSSGEKQISFYPSSFLLPFFLRFSHQAQLGLWSCSAGHQRCALHRFRHLHMQSHQQIGRGRLHHQHQSGR